MLAKIEEKIVINITSPHMCTLEMSLYSCLHSNWLLHKVVLTILIFSQSSSLGINDSIKGKALECNPYNNHGPRNKNEKKTKE